MLFETYETLVTKHASTTRRSPKSAKHCLTLSMAKAAPYQRARKKHAADKLRQKSFM